MNPKKVIGIGELLWDVLPAGKRIGGAPVNFTHYVNQSGCEGYAVSAIGSDASGDELLAKFVSLGLNADYLQRNAFPTGSVGVTLDDKGVPTYDIYENVAWDNIATDEATLALAASADAVCWGSLAQRSDVSRRTILAIVDAVRSDALKVFDINLRQNYYDEPTRRIVGTRHGTETQRRRVEGACADVFALGRRRGATAATLGAFLAAICRIYHGCSRQPYSGCGRKPLVCRHTEGNRG